MVAALTKAIAQHLTEAIGTSLLVLAAAPQCPPCPASPDFVQLVKLLDSRCTADVSVGIWSAALLLLLTFVLGAAAGHLLTWASAPGRAAPRKGACLPAAGG